MSVCLSLSLSLSVSVAVSVSLSLVPVQVIIAGFAFLVGLEVWETDDSASKVDALSIGDFSCF